MSQTNQHQTRQQRAREARVHRLRRSNLLLLVLGIACVLLLGVGILGVTNPSIFGTDIPNSSTDRDLQGNPVRQEGLEPSSSEKSAQKVDDLPTRFQVPSLAMNVGLSEMNAVNHSVTPPTFRRAYVVRNLGVTLDKADQGTVFVAMHSLAGSGFGPGNYLYDTDTGKARVQVGSEVIVDSVKYKVDSTLKVEKPKLSSNSEVWKNIPDRLVVITCLELPSGGPSQQNFVVIATRERS